MTEEYMQMLCERQQIPTITWILANELGHASEIITNFHKAYPDKPSPWK